MSKQGQRYPATSLATIHTWMNRIGSIQLSGYHADVPDASVAGMTVGQAQLVWSSATALFTYDELSGILADSLRESPVLKPIYTEDISTLESVQTRQDAFESSVFCVLRMLAATVPGLEIDDRGSCVVLNRPLWSHLTHHLLAILVQSGQAAESLEELMLSRDLAL